MSSFLVENKTINVIVRSLACSYGFEYVRKPLEELEYDFLNYESMEKLANDMFNLNVYALNCRYKDVKKMIGKRIFKYCTVIPENKLRIHKALSCFLYQCMEGDADTKPLYLALRETQDHIANDIVRNLEEWEKADMWR